MVADFSRQKPEGSSKDELGKDEVAATKQSRLTVIAVLLAVVSMVGVAVTAMVVAGVRSGLEVVKVEEPKALLTPQPYSVDGGSSFGGTVRAMIDKCTQGRTAMAEDRRELDYDIGGPAMAPTYRCFVACTSDADCEGLLPPLGEMFTHCHVAGWKRPRGAAPKGACIEAWAFGQGDDFR